MNRLLLIVLLLLASSAWAGPMEDAMAANERGDYALELSITRPNAEKGQAWAQTTLGLMYSDGQGAAQDDSEAVKWLSLAAAQGFAPAQVILGLMYFSGKGLAQDRVRGLMWLTLSAESGHAASAKQRDIATKHMPPQHIAEAQKLARECQARNFKGC